MNSSYFYGRNGDDFRSIMVIKKTAQVFCNHRSLYTYIPYIQTCHYTKDLLKIVPTALQIVIVLEASSFIAFIVIAFVPYSLKIR